MSDPLVIHKTNRETPSKKHRIFNLDSRPCALAFIMYLVRINRKAEGKISGKVVILYSEYRPDNKKKPV